ncbi:hypothetical protein [Tropicibacter naphthalenivorans]|uniref:Uncharacterized protein n=1 Tax=Tropicibacter naphthalenivorans TaxID=441103 RepID=A0A0P1GMR7_9RHOB|nr:hypothetical protein [Tropicibacter naphthalenivorans]CUH75447.1 hypothetical protein TRN7648_00444 [Tropicibacter naphthalenivorans]SMC44431.1 hypothetical protein SAMN04488093_101435 [Tropicibacter naphthalenivorans]
MLCNIIDHRKRRHRWRNVVGLVEATYQDNGAADADQAEGHPGLVLCEERKGLTLAEAVAWAQGFDVDVTLFIYDGEE